MIDFSEYETYKRSSTSVSQVQVPLLPGKDIEHYRVVAATSHAYTCMECGTIFAFYDDQRDSATELDYSTVQLCNRCLLRWEFKRTDKGRRLVEFYLDKQIMGAYKSAEFNNFDTAGAYCHALESARLAVIRWAQQAVQEGCKTSFYLYSQSGAHGTGCGNGKTRLMWSAFKYVARRMPVLFGGIHYAPRVDFECRHLDPDAIVNIFLSDLARCGDEKPEYNINDPWKDRRKGSFDEYLNAFIGRRVLFIDDIGSGTLRGMHLRVIESIVDTRANASLPTFYTSNYSPQELAKRIGDRAASRITRPDCVVHCLKAPDYCMQKGRAQGA